MSTNVDRWVTRARINIVTTYFKTKSVYLLKKYWLFFSFLNSSFVLQSYAMITFIGNIVVVIAVKIY